MSEKILQIDGLHPADIFGVQDANLNRLRQLFPKLKLIARGEFVKVIGDKNQVNNFVNRFELLMVHAERFGPINENALEQIMGPDPDHPLVMEQQDQDILVHGRNGLMIKARTPNQQKMVASAANNDLLFAIGPAGTGKTYTAVALAVRALKAKQVKRIILTRPAVEAGENLGFLPGDLKEKLDPYLRPLYDALRDMLPQSKLESYLEDGTIEIAPLAFMRGRTLDHVFAILDEAQNTSQNQLKMFLTRMGRSAKFIVTGDVTQIDLPRHQVSGLVEANEILKKIKGVDFVFLNEKDIIRHNLVGKIIDAYKQSNLEK